MMFRVLFLLILSWFLIDASPFNNNLILKNYHDSHTKTEDPEIYRLPNHVFPKRYSLRVVPDLDKFTFTGEVEITVRIKFTTDKIELHSNGLTVSKCELRSGDQFETITSTMDITKELLIIKASRKLPFDSEYILSVSFEGTLKDDMLGLYVTWYKDNKGDKKWMAATQFEATYARKAFPCFDEPRYKTPFTISIACYTSQIAVSNMPTETISTKNPALNDRVWVIFKETPPMPTYLVSFMISEFSSKKDSDSFVTIYARPNAIQYTNYALQQSRKLIHSTANFVSVAYTLPKLDVIAIPDLNFGAMENWGMTTYRERFVILDELNSAESHKSVVTSLISHEFAHQWFGDLVTPVWWDYIWMNEGFATYFEYTTAFMVEPLWDLDQLFVVFNVQYALWEEVDIRRAMTSRIKHQSQTTEIFDIVSYEKAASVIRMFEHIMSTNSFRCALNEYLLEGYKNHGGSVTPKLLYNAFESQAATEPFFLPFGYTITDIMKSWTENIGYPVITVVRDEITGEVLFEQTTYRTPRTKTPAPHQFWVVPITYITKSKPQFYGTRPSLWSTVSRLPPRIKNLPKNDWVLLNLNQTGYYRVNYSPIFWKLLVNQLQDDHSVIPVLNRAQLLDDSFVFAMDDAIPFTIPIDMANYLEKEKEISPWLTFSTQIDRLYSKFRATPNFQKIRIFMEKIMEKAYQIFKFEIKPNDAHIVKVGKPLILNVICRVEVRKCIEESIKEYQTNVKDIAKVQPDLKKVVFCSALRYGPNPDEIYNNLWSTFLKSNIAYDATTILMILGCAKDEKILKKTLEKLVAPDNDEIHKSDIVYVMRNFFTYPESVAAALKFLIDKIPVLKATETKVSSTLEQIVSKISSKIENQEQLKLLEEVLVKSQKLDKKTFYNLIKSIENTHHSVEEGMLFNAEMAKRFEEAFSISASKNEDKKNNHSDDKRDSTSKSNPSTSALAASYLCLIVVSFFNI